VQQQPRPERGPIPAKYSEDGKSYTWQWEAEMRLRDTLFTVEFDCPGCEEVYSAWYDGSDEADADTTLEMEGCGNAGGRWVCPACWEIYTRVRNAANASGL
jgi:hypothetical protein